MAAVQYITTAALKLAMSSTDAGTGTAAGLTEAELTEVIGRASNRVSSWVGQTFDTDLATPAFDVPPMVVDLTTQIAVYYAWLNYLKGKPMSAQHPAYLGYQDAMATLKAINAGDIRIDPQPAGGLTEVAIVINPNRGPIFTDEDSNVSLGPQGELVAGTPVTGDPWRMGNR